MKRKTRITFILTFLYEQKPLLLLTALSLGIFGGMFYLYQLEMEAWLYATGLCLLLLVVVLTVRFVCFYRSHWERQRRLSSIEYDWCKLAVPQTLESADYQEMIRALGVRCTELSTQWQNEQQESLDYYTTWVHQIKTPIAVMRMLLQTEDTEEHRALSAELFRIEQYVEMVLSYIRLGNGGNDFVFQEYDLDSLIRQSIRKYAPQFVHRKIRLIYEPVQVTVLTDEKWLSFLLEQLLSNAVKYTYQGSVTIRVTPDKKLTIADTGIGIAPEDLPRIFEKGFTGYNGRANKKATGLGLYLCKQAAEKLGITLTAESQPGIGSAFTLDLEKGRLEVE